MIDHIAIAAKVRELAARFPHRKADSFYFNSDHSPCCIVGHALHELRIPLPDEVVNGAYWWETPPCPEWDIEADHARQFIDDVQEQQDNGKTWGEAVAIVDGP